MDSQLGLALCRGIAAISLRSHVLPSRNKEQELHPEDWAMLHSHEGLELASETESVPQKHAKRWDGYVPSFSVIVPTLCLSFNWCLLNK